MCRRDEIEAVVLDVADALLMPDPAAFHSRLAPFGVEPDDEACHRAPCLGLAETDRLGGVDFTAVNRTIAAPSPSGVEAEAWVHDLLS